MVVDTNTKMFAVVHEMGLDQKKLGTFRLLG